MICPYNLKTFVAASECTRKVNKGPWLDEQFEQIVVLVKQRLLETTGKANIRPVEFETLFLGLEITLNN